MEAEALQNLGQRIVQAARMAVAMHLADVMLTDDRRRNINIGGAGEDGFTDEAPPTFGDRLARPSDTAEGGAA